MSTNLLEWPGRVCALDDHPRAPCVEETLWHMSLISGRVRERTSSGKIRNTTRI